MEPAQTERGRAADGLSTATLRSRASRLAADPPMAPARILASQPQHERAHLSRDGRAPSRAGRLSPLPGHERAMPTQQRSRSDQARAARGVRQVASRRRQQGTIRGAKVRPRYLAAQDLELVTKNEQLDVLDAQATATPNERSQERPERHVEKREGHGRRSSQPGPRKVATPVLAPFTRRTRRRSGCRVPLRRHRPITARSAPASSMALISGTSGATSSVVTRGTMRSPGAQLPGARDVLGRQLDRC